MIKLSEFIGKEFQPSEKSRMKNFLKRGSRDQEVIYVDNPVNTQYQVGKTFDDPSGMFESDEDIEIELEQWDAFENAILTTLKEEYNIDSREDYNLVLETAGDPETTKVKKKGIHIADYYVSWLKREGNDDLQDLVGLTEDRLPEDFELNSYKDVKELTKALCMDSAYGIVSLVISDYILLDIRKEDVGLDGNKQIVNKIGATGFTAFSQNEVKRFQEIADISNENQGQLEKMQQALIGREFQTLEDLSKMCSRLRQSGYAQSDIEEFLRTYIL